MILYALTTNAFSGTRLISAIASFFVLSDFAFHIANLHEIGY